MSWRNKSNYKVFCESVGMDTDAGEVATSTTLQSSEQAIIDAIEVSGAVADEVETTIEHVRLTEGVEITEEQATEYSTVQDAIEDREVVVAQATAKRERAVTSTCKEIVDIVKTVYDKVADKLDNVNLIKYPVNITLCSDTMGEELCKTVDELVRVNHPCSVDDVSFNPNNGCYVMTCHNAEDLDKAYDVALGVANDVIVATETLSDKVSSLCVVANDTVTSNGKVVVDNTPLVTLSTPVNCALVMCADAAKKCVESFDVLRTTPDEVEPMAVADDIYTVDEWCNTPQITDANKVPLSSFRESWNMFANVVTLLHRKNEENSCIFVQSAHTPRTKVSDIRLIEQVASLLSESDDIESMAVTVTAKPTITDWVMPISKIVDMTNHLTIIQVTETAMSIGVAKDIVIVDDNEAINESATKGKIRNAWYNFKKKISVDPKTTGDWEMLEAVLLDWVDTIGTKAEINAAVIDVGIAEAEMEQAIQKAMDNNDRDLEKKHRAHLKWLQKTLKPALIKRKKQL